MVNKITVFAFNGESMCFAHALLNSLGIKPDKPFQVVPENKNSGILDCMCKTPSQMETPENAKEQEIPLCD